MTIAPLFAGIGGHHSARSRTDEWYTPPEIIAALGGADSFDLDPCAPPVQPFPTARRTFTKADNGLLQAWDGRVWLNPPYSSDVIGQWLGRMAGHGIGTALIFARTETDAFFRFVWERTHALLFLRGRINFYLPDGTRAKKNSGAPSVLCAYGLHDMDVLAFCGLKGQFVPLRLPRSVLVEALTPTWREALADWMKDRAGVRLDEIYRAFEDHPKARSNPNFKAKLRQQLQLGPYRRVGRGEWAPA